MFNILLAIGYFLLLGFIALSDITGMEKAFLVTILIIVALFQGLSISADED